MTATGVGAQESAGNMRHGLSLRSEILDRAVGYSVYLPFGYEESSRSYPIVYILHGAGGHERFLAEGGLPTSFSELISTRSIQPVILVMPDGGNTRYLNNYNATVRYEDFFFQEFIPEIESTYRVNSSKRNRAILGFSMGGYGALVYGLKHADMFSSTVSFGGSFCEDDRVLSMTNEQWNASTRGPVYGLNLAGENRSTEHYRENDPCFIVSTADPNVIGTIGIYLDCGDEDFRNDGNAVLHALLRSRSIPHEYRVRDGGHSLEYFRGGLGQALQFVSGNFGSP